MIVNRDTFFVPGVQGGCIQLCKRMQLIRFVNFITNINFENDIKNDAFESGRKNHYFSIKFFWRYTYSNFKIMY